MKLQCVDSSLHGRSEELRHFGSIFLITKRIITSFKKDNLILFIHLFYKLFQSILYNCIDSKTFYFFNILFQKRMCFLELPLLGLKIKFAVIAYSKC